MFFRQHALMEDTGHQNALWLAPKKHHMTALFHPAQTGSDMIAGAARCRVVGESLATGFQVADIADGLAMTPSTQGVIGDVRQVGIHTAR